MTRIIVAAVISLFSLTALAGPEWGEPSSVEHKGAQAFIVAPAKGDTGRTSFRVNRGALEDSVTMTCSPASAAYCEMFVHGCDNANGVLETTPEGVSCTVET